MKNNGQNPSWSTIFTLVNSMIGGTMLTLPILFRVSGIFTGLIVLLISGLISYATCRLYILHISIRQSKIQQTIKRILGTKWESFFKGLSGFYMGFIIIIYVELIVDQAYNIIYFAFKMTGHQDWIAEKGIKQLVFDKFSIQYLTLIAFIPLFAMMFIKNLTILIRLSSAGVLSVFVYVGFIIYQSIVNYSYVDIDDIPLFDTNVGNLAGTCALAFTLHVIVNPIIKANKNQNNNLRDLKVSYVLGFIFYAIIGFLGCIAVLGKKCQVTIVNCYLDDWQAVMVEGLYFYGLITVYPNFVDIGRTRTLQFFYPQNPTKNFTLYNLILIIVASACNFFSPFLPLDLIMNLVGSLLTYFFIYVIPTQFHWKCLYYTPEAPRYTLLTTSEGEELNCPHKKDYADKCPRLVRKIFYGSLNVVGLGVAGYGVYQFIDQIFLQ